jgi:alkylhydroperoxidase family enzyme
LSDAALGIVRDTGADVQDKVAEGVLSPAEGAVLRYTDAMTKTVTVPEEVFQAVKEHFNDREIVEITATNASYNCVSRFLVALDVGEKNH